MRNLGKLGVVAALVLAACGGAIDNSADESALDVAPSGRGGGTADAPISQARPSGGARTNGISYHGGPVMLGAVPVYYIWYGNWSGNSATTLLPTLVGDLSGSGYEHINTTYYNGSKQHVSG